MSEHLPLGSRGGSPLPFHRLQETSHPRPHGNPDPLASVWIRRLHLTPNPLPQASLAAPPPPLQQGYDAVSSRSAGFGPLRWSPRPPPVAAWDAAPVPDGSGSGPPMLSPFFRLPPPLPRVADVGGFAPIRPTIGFGSRGGGFPELSSRAIVGDGPHASWLATAAAGSAYPRHAVDMVPIRTSHDPHVRQHNMAPQNFARSWPSSSSQHDEPFSYWNMGRFQRSTTTSSISVAPTNFVKKRNADSNSFIPPKFRKLNGAG